jgi:hypothetical protein
LWRGQKVPELIVLIAGSWMTEPT